MLYDSFFEIKGKIINLLNVSMKDINKRRSKKNFPVSIIAH